MPKIYLKKFRFPGRNREENFLADIQMTCYNNYYPFKTLPWDLEELELKPVTILYGGNGSGKTTILNLIAEKLNIQRKTCFNKSCFFDDFVNLCHYEIQTKPNTSKIITSDDVFNNIFELREKNENIDHQREETIERKFEYSRPGALLKDLMGDVNYLENLDKLKEILDARKNTASQFVKSRVKENIIGKSNGETAIEFFTHAINDEGLYLLDEPENSLSALYQVELTKYLADSARFFGAQLIIATHSPFVLSIPGAKIYNLDTEPVSITDDWTTLENMRVYHEFFKQYAYKFEKLL